MNEAVGEQKREPIALIPVMLGSRDVFRKLKAPPNGGIINAKEQTNKRREKITSNGVPRSQTSPSLLAGILGCRDVGGARGWVARGREGLFNESKVAAVSFRLGEYVAREMS